jgi:catalase
MSLTTASGIPVLDNQNSLTVGPSGPILLQDFHLIEKLQHFNRERIPERVVHAKGSGAYGKFTLTHDISQFTTASLFQTVGSTTDVFVRFSTVGGEKGSADTERDPRGFAIKFYTQEGNWDLVGNNTPMFFIKDPIKFPDFVHTQKRDPATNLKSPNMVWDFWAHSPESLHQITMLFSTRGIPDGYRHMDGFGSHVFSMTNSNGEVVWVKYHFKTNQGIKNLTPEAATALAGSDPDYAQRFPSWTMSIQVMTEAQRESWEKRTGWSAFDLTKVWPYSDFPRIPVGQLELNRNVSNYHAEVEQAAFSPANIVPGLGFSPDKMLQGRLFAYHDAQLYRVGTNHQQLPVNRPKCPVMHHQRDGAMDVSENPHGAKNYGCYLPALPTSTLPWTVMGNFGRYDTRDTDDHYSQAGNLFRLMPKEEQELLCKNIAGSLKHASKEIQELQLQHFQKADVNYASRIRALL